MSHEMALLSYNNGLDYTESMSCYIPLKNAWFISFVNSKNTGWTKDKTWFACEGTLHFLHCLNYIMHCTSTLIISMRNAD